MACESQAGLEAQKLISISLGKMAASRVGRTGASLHKSLLVASVLHRARHVFLEETYHVHRAVPPQHCPQPSQVPLTPSPAPLPAPAPSGVPVYAPLLPPPPPPQLSDEGVTTEDKENQSQEQQQPPQQEQAGGDGARSPLSESNSGRGRGSGAVKRRRCVSHQETQEAVWSILPKRPRTTPQEPPPPLQDQQEASPGGTNMEVEQITSLVSIFSFGGPRSDLCGAEAAREEVAQFQPVALAV